MVVSLKKIIIFVAILLAIGLAVFFWIRDISLFLELHFLPSASAWQTVHMSNGQTLYGHIAGMNSEVLKLSEPYSLDIFRRAATSSYAVYDVSDSSNFSLGGNIAESSKRILTKKSGPAYVILSNILYWENVAPDDDVLQYLK